ncbi:hypothetical protein K2Z83_19565 [Oscillochloris sp. ZM17-4]|uniref:hypothetical protein n=1 Tax=Oscillochloris sp. ZM17-4 TaxID=2866714 RepID=UPI001C72D7CE|nr:hypothetical protein [Oscillochloris sp. ZM17-4]MBX0329866.1 hypothetical protein [Oscillochloris sp. ZM17-4]
MTQPPRETTSHDAVAQLITMLEMRRSELPFADEELARHRALRSALEEQDALGEQSLAEWRQALSQRWRAEVIGQRAYIAIQQQISSYFGNDALYLQLVAPSQPASALTAGNLLSDMRRLEASLALLRPRPPFAEESLAQLREAGDRLSAAIEWSEHCEAERRRALIEQRLAANLYERVCQKTRRLMAAHTRGELAA